MRDYTVRICAPLEVEDHVVQPHPDVSPPKWHLGHTTWFFETFLLEQYTPRYTVHHPRYGFLFNSYYESVGERILRPERGLLTRPTVAEVLAYRAAIDEAMEALLASLATQGRADEETAEVLRLVKIGLHHEQQHQELLFTDLKNILANNPLLPAYLPADASSIAGQSVPLRMLAVPGGLHPIGHDAQRESFAYDNESPRHKTYFETLRIANRPVSCGEYLEFIRDGGYRDFRHWLSDGWSRVCTEGWSAPLYWMDASRPTLHSGVLSPDTEFQVFTLNGLRDLDLSEPVCHISYYEAAAYANWAGKRLPTEAEWETAVKHFEVTPEASGQGNVAGLRQDGVPLPERYHPAAPSSNAADTNTPLQIFGDVWEWTGSAYLAYPGYQALDGALGEYNGKFMSDQMVLRGGSCATPAGHIRATYRNFFQPFQRWQFSGVRLADNE